MYLDCAGFFDWWNEKEVRKGPHKTRTKYLDSNSRTFVRSFGHDNGARSIQNRVFNIR